ncbi:DUF3060 domain-containing protein [Leucobacter musarum]|uniref:DUF3060 domain-containing protein n=1 Tax=Leucobacter musarum TaxID=1930747 RepID=UPI0034D1D26F
MTIVAAGWLTSCSVSSPPTPPISEPATVHCANRDVFLEDAGTNVNLVGSCASVTVAASSIEVTGDGTESLILRGSENRVTLDQIEVMDIEGRGNHVVWQEGISVSEEMFPGNTLDGPQ